MIEVSSITQEHADDLDVIDIENDSTSKRKRRLKNETPDASLKQKKKTRLNTSKLSLIKAFDDLSYNNDLLPVIRFPTTSSVPDHLMNEFKILFPLSSMKKKRGGKCSLVPTMSLDGRQAEFMAAKWMRSFWTPGMLNMLVEVILKKRNITLSMLDWLCIGYAKEKNVHYHLSQNNSPMDFYIHEEYEQNLHVFKRGCFDFFSRNQRLLIEYEDVTYNTDTPSDITDSIEDSDPKLNPSVLGDLQIRWDSKEIVGVRYLKSETAPTGFKKMIYLITSSGQLTCFHWAQTNKVIDYCKEHAELIKPSMKAAKKKNKNNIKRRRLCEAAPKSWVVKKVSVVLKYDVVNSIVADSDNLIKPTRQEEFVWVDPKHEEN